VAPKEEDEEEEVRHWFLIVSQMNPVHIFHSYSFKVKLKLSCKFLKTQRG
jgi:hypothetical protein